MMKVAFAKYPWHMKILIAYLLIHGLWSLVGIGFALHAAPASMNLGLIDYYLFFSIPILILISAGLLYKGNQHVTIPLFLLPFLYYLSALKLYPDLLDTTYHALDIHYLLLIPPLYRACMLFFIACGTYCIFLKKHQILK